MCFGDSALEVALALLEDGIAEEDLPTALAAHAFRLAESDIPFAVTD